MITAQRNLRHFSCGILYSCSFVPYSWSMADKGKLAASSSDDEEIENLFQMQPIPLDSPIPTGSVPPVISTPDRGDKANLLPPGAISSSSPAPSTSVGLADVTSPRVYNTLNGKRSGRGRITGYVRAGIVLQVVWCLTGSTM